MKRRSRPGREPIKGRRGETPEPKSRNAPKAVARSNTSSTGEETGGRSSYVEDFAVRATLPAVAIFGAKRPEHARHREVREAVLHSILIPGVIRRLAADLVAEQHRIEQHRSEHDAAALLGFAFVEMIREAAFGEFPSVTTGGVASSKANADRSAANVLPIIEQIKALLDGLAS